MRTGKYSFTKKHCPYPPHTYTHGDPHTHGRVQGCCGDGISIPIPMGIPIPMADLLFPQPW